MLPGSSQKKLKDSTLPVKLTLNKMKIIEAALNI